MEIIKSQTLNDKEKQNALFKQIPIQLISLFKLILGIFLFISPFIGLLAFDRYFSPVNAEALYHFEGILVSIIAVILFIALKKKYGTIFKSRENTP